MSRRVRSTRLLLAALVAGAAPLAAQGTSPQKLLGTWRMDTTKFEKHDRQLVDLSLTLSRQGDTLLVVTEGRDVTGPAFTMKNRLIPDNAAGGQPLDSVSHIGRLTWAGDTMVVHSIDKRPQRTLDIEERWLLLDDGKTLWRFQSVRDGERLSRQVLVFSRVP